MSVIIILLLPLIATALVCLPFKKSWAAGVTVVFSLATLILSARIAWLVSAGNVCHDRLERWLAQMDCCGRLERADFAVDCVRRDDSGDFLRRLHGARKFETGKTPALLHQLQPVRLFHARHSGSGRADVGLDCGRIDDALFRVARLV